MTRKDRSITALAAALVMAAAMLTGCSVFRDNIAEPSIEDWNISVKIDCDREVYSLGWSAEHMSGGVQRADEDPFDKGDVVQLGGNGSPEDTQDRYSTITLKAYDEEGTVIAETALENNFLRVNPLELTLTNDMEFVYDKAAIAVTYMSGSMGDAISIGDGAAEEPGRQMIDFSMSISAAFKATDISELDEYFLITDTLPDGTVNEYYAYEAKVGDIRRPVLQFGEYYCATDEEAYARLKAAFGLQAAVSSEKYAASADDAGMKEFYENLDDNIRLALIQHGHNGLPYHTAGTAYTLIDVRPYGEGFAYKNVDGDDPNSRLMSVYLIAAYRQYEVINGNVAETGGYDIPMVLDFHKYGALKRLTVPKDGAERENSIKEMFPEDIWDAVFAESRNSEQREQEAEAQAMELYAKRDNIGKMISAIASSPTFSSNPGDYLHANPQEFAQFIALGENTIHYCADRFASDAEQGLETRIMEQVCREIIDNGMDEEVVQSMVKERVK